MTLVITIRVVAFLLNLIWAAALMEILMRGLTGYSPLRAIGSFLARFKPRRKLTHAEIWRELESADREADRAIARALQDPKSRRSRRSRRGQVRT